MKVDKLAKESIDTVKESINKYKRSGAITRIEVDGEKVRNGHIAYHGDKIEYESYARATFVESFGDEIVEIDGQERLGESCGHIILEAWDDQWSLNIETAHTTLIEMTHLDIRILKKLSSFLNYIVDGLAKKEINREGK